MVCMLEHQILRASENAITRLVFHPNVRGRSGLCRRTCRPRWSRVISDVFGFPVLHHRQQQTSREDKSIGWPFRRALRHRRFPSAMTIFGAVTKVNDGVISTILPRIGRLRSFSHAQDQNTNRSNRLADLHIVYLCIESDPESSRF